MFHALPTFICATSDEMLGAGREWGFLGEHRPVLITST